MKPDPRADAQAYVSRPDLKPPEVFIARSGPGRTPGYVFLGPKGGRAMGPMIVDDAGQLVWFRPVTGGRVAMDVRTQSYGGKPVLDVVGGPAVRRRGPRRRHGARRAIQGVQRVQMGNGFAADSHEFTITPQGTALMNAWDAIQRPEGRCSSRWCRRSTSPPGSCSSMAQRRQRRRQRDLPQARRHLGLPAPELGRARPGRRLRALRPLHQRHLQGLAGDRSRGLAARRQALVLLLRGGRVRLRSSTMPALSPTGR